MVNNVQNLVSIVKKRPLMCACAELIYAFANVWWTTRCSTTPPSFSRIFMKFYTDRYWIQIFCWALEVMITQWGEIISEGIFVSSWGFLRRPQSLKKSSAWFLHLLCNVKTNWGIFPNFVTFSEYINFIFLGFYELFFKMFILKVS